MTEGVTGEDESMEMTPHNAVAGPGSQCHALGKDQQQQPKGFAPSLQPTAPTEDEIWLRAFKNNDLCKCGSFIKKKEKKK